MSVLANTALNEASPTTTTLPLSTISPSLAVAERFPPTADVVKFKPCTPVTVAWPNVSFVVRATAPVTFNWLKLIDMFAVVAMKFAPPPTSKRPLSSRTPFAAVATRSPPIVDAERFRPNSFVTVALPREPLVVNETGPETFNWASVIDVFAVVAVKFALPPTSRSPLSSSVPLLDTATRSPPIVDAERFRPNSFVTVALPREPLVVSPTAPVTFSVPRSIIAFAAEVVKLASPATATTPSSVTLPDVAVSVKSPLMDDAASATSCRLRMLALPAPASTSSVGAETLMGFAPEPIPTEALSKTEPPADVALIAPSPSVRIFPAEAVRRMVPFPSPVPEFELSTLALSAMSPPVAVRVTSPSDSAFTSPSMLRVAAVICTLAPAMAPCTPISPLSVLMSILPVPDAVSLLSRILPTAPPSTLAFTVIDPLPLVMNSRSAP